MIFVFLRSQEIVSFKNFKRLQEQFDLYFKNQMMHVLYQALERAVPLCRCVVVSFC